MRMLNGFVVVVALLGLVVCPSLGRADDIVLKSPNGFPTRNGIDMTINCTFFCDGMSKTAGWQLKFADLTHSNAMTWAANVLNANKSMVPKAGSIMVLDAFNGSAKGHVAWCTGVTKNKDGTYTIVVLEGFTRGKPYGKVNSSWDYFQHSWTISSGSAPTALVSGGSIKIKLLAFLSQK
jgi:hypothetical protein